MLLDPPDPVDLLIAHTHADQAVNLGARQDELSLQIGMATVHCVGQL